MKSCILTVIKNEHEYLDEWIRYHLDLGISHIFIFEDIDSDSHKKITDKYVDDVSLNSIQIVLDEESKKKVLDLKLTKQKNPQDIYFLKSLMWIKENDPQYDWCFLIDNDEFLTIETTLNELLETYKNYDAFVLQWKIYGANGLINKPNYTNKGLMETYTKESNYPGHSVLEWTTKTCYNLKSFKESYMKNCHQPTDECNWCKTDFSHSRNRIVYAKAFLRHYMTKSWDEYISKRKRGYFMGFARTTDLFFKINSDMLPMKNELINNLKNEMLVVLPFKQNSSQGNEIKIALNGWKKFCKFKYHLIVIGEFNEHLKSEFSWVEFIYCPCMEKKEGQYNPHLDMLNKFKVIMKMYSQIYDGFIYTCDDYYAIKPFEIEDILKIYYINTEFNGNEKAPTHYWAHDKWKTRQLLNREGLPHINYTTHFPYYMEFSKLKEICNKFNMYNESYVFDDVYFNYFKHDEPIKADTIRLGIWNQSIYKNEFQKAIDNPSIKFVCNSVEGWSKELENDLGKITT